MAAVNGVCEMANCHRQTPCFFFSQENNDTFDVRKIKVLWKIRKLTMPMIALRGLTVLPQMTVNFDIIRDKSIAGGGAGYGGRSASISGDAEAAGRGDPGY